MKIWKKFRFLKKNKQIETIIRSYLNYVFNDSNLNDLEIKYHMNSDDIEKLKQTLADRMAGLYLLTLAKDEKRLHDIVLKYQQSRPLLLNIIPEIEGYVEK